MSSIQGQITARGVKEGSDLNPSVVLEQLNDTSVNVDGTDDSATDIEPDAGTKAAAIANTGSAGKKKTFQASKNGPAQAREKQKKHVEKTDKQKAHGKNNGSVKSGRASNSHGSKDKPMMTAGSNGALHITDQTEESKTVVTAEKNASGNADVGNKGKGGGSVGKPRASLDKAKSPKTSKSVTFSGSGKSEDVKSVVKPRSVAAAMAMNETAKCTTEDAKGEATCARGNDDEGSIHKPPTAAESKNGAADKNRKRKASCSSEEQGTAEDTQLNVSSNLDPSAIKQPPTKSPKIQCAGGSQTEARACMNVIPNGAGSSVVPQNVMPLSGTIAQRGRAPSRRLYANVGNRPAPDIQQFMTAAGRGYPRGSARGQGVGIGTHGGRGGAAPARGRPMQPRGMPIRGRGRVLPGVGGTRDGPVNAVGHADGRLMAPAPACVNNVQLLKPVPVDSATVRTCECLFAVLC